MKSMVCAAVSRGAGKAGRVAVAVVESPMAGISHGSGSGMANKASAMPDDLNLWPPIDGESKAEATAKNANAAASSAQRAI